MMQARDHAKRACIPSEPDESSTSEDFNDSSDEQTFHEGADGGGADFWEGLLRVLSKPEDTDVIRQCENVDIDDILDKTEKYFDQADKELHVFPFKDVHPCWHRLYTDTSIIRAIRQVPSSIPAAHNSNIEWLGRVAQMLDTGMIMTGGFGREDMLSKIYNQLDRILSGFTSEQHRAKRPKTVELLPSEEHSIPKLKYQIKYTLQRPALQAFEKFMHEKKEPVLLTKILDHWPALEKWQSTEYWRRLTLGGRRLIPVEVGRSYVDADWSQKTMPFDQFLNEYIINENDEKGYLAQYDLFHHLPKLNMDIATPDYCFLDAPIPELETRAAEPKIKSGLALTKLATDEVQKNIWYGPAWTISPLHHDPYHNILCQVVGKKYIRLYSPRYSPRLYPRAKEEPAPHGQGTIDMSNTSSVDIAALELSPDEDWDEKWPGISEVPYQEVILEAGQALYIPVGWWHYIRSCSVCISVSFWWS